MTRTDASRAATRKAEQNRVKKVRAAGMRPQHFFLPDEVLVFLDEVKAVEGFRRRDQAAAFLIREAKRRRAGLGREETLTVTT